MQRFVNDPDYIVEDMVKGYVKKSTQRSDQTFRSK